MALPKDILTSRHGYLCLFQRVMRTKPEWTGMSSNGFVKTDLGGWWWQGAGD